MSTDDLRHAALRDKAATDAAAHRAANARLCRWLGVEPKRCFLIAMDGENGGTEFASREEAQIVIDRFTDGLRGSTGYRVATISEELITYPDLATREGFWTLWDALKAKGYTVSCSGFPKSAEASILEGFEVVSNDRATTEEAALFAAACELMEREGGNG